MNIILQTKLFGESDYENLGDLERLPQLLSVLEDERLIHKVYRNQGKGRND